MGGIGKRTGRSSQQASLGYVKQKKKKKEGKRGIGKNLAEFLQYTASFVIPGFGRLRQKGSAVLTMKPVLDRFRTSPGSKLFWVGIDNLCFPNKSTSKYTLLLPESKCLLPFYKCKNDSQGVGEETAQ